jgi:prepilin-type N-terminal cleavage/methylation domain-containing protein
VIAMRHSSQGLTLLEVLIALALLCLIGAVLYPGLRTSVQAWTRTAEHADEIENNITSERFVRTEIEQLLPVMQITGTTQALAFRGDQRALEFVSPLPQLRALPGLYNIRLYGATQGSATLELRCQYELWRNQSLRSTAPEVVLLTDLTDIRFAYQMARDPAWQSVWSRPDVLPARVRVELATRTGRTQTWVIPVRAQSFAATPNATH